MLVYKSTIMWLAATGENEMKGDWRGPPTQERPAMELGCCNNLSCQKSLCLRTLPSYIAWLTEFTDKPNVSLLVVKPFISNVE